MGIVDRVRNMLFVPKEEWPRIAAEPATVGSIYSGYVMMLAAIPARRAGRLPQHHLRDHAIT